MNEEILGMKSFTGKFSQCAGVIMKFRCFNNSLGIPDKFNDWEELGYVKSLLHYRVGYNDF